MLDILDTVWRDTIKTRILQSDGSYARIDKRGKELLSSQDVFKEEAAAAYEKIKNKNPGISVPRCNPERRIDGQQ